MSCSCGLTRRVRFGSSNRYFCFCGEDSVRINTCCRKPIKMTMIGSRFVFVVLYVWMTETVIGGGPLPGDMGHLLHLVSEFLFIYFLFT